MYGRYGQDELALCMLALAVLLGFISVFPHLHAFYYVSLVLIALALYRCFSKNTYRRRLEREKYLRLIAKPQRFFRIQRRRFQERKTYDYYKCAGCGTYNRVPKGHGRIVITCPKCHNQFEKG